MTTTRRCRTMAATLVFRSRRAGRFAVVLRKLGAVAETVLTRMPEDHYPAVSHDGTKVAYSFRENGKMPIFVVAASGGAPEQVCDDCGEVEEWSPGGDEILYVTPHDPSRVGLLKVGTPQNDAMVAALELWDLQPPAFLERLGRVQRQGRQVCARQGVRRQSRRARRRARERMDCRQSGRRGTQRGRPTRASCTSGRTAMARRVCGRNDSIRRRGDPPGRR